MPTILICLYDICSQCVPDCPSFILLWITVCRPAVSSYPHSVTDQRGQNIILSLFTSFTNNFHWSSAFFYVFYIFEVLSIIIYHTPEQFSITATQDGSYTKYLLGTDQTTATNFWHNCFPPFFTPSAIYFSHRRRAQIKKLFR